ncbi:MAG: hypothetical protein EHM93_05350 [Bacteroidales bacterium]|nr:MAG: hypothetical protein EHM93_05350 [Bacteroidales bacterium]
MIKSYCLFALIVLNIQCLAAQTLDSSIVNQTINTFLHANTKEKQKVKKKIIQLSPDFNYLYSQLKEGKRYSKEVSKGFFEHNFKNALGVEHPNLVFIPYKYNPAKKYQVRIFLHGAVSTFDMRQWVSTVNRMDTVWRSVNTINLYPASWALSKWWNYSQYENISKLLEYVKETYNVDENDISITGISDGATGIYYLTNFYQTPFSCLMPFIGSIEMLTFLTNKQFFIKNYQNLSFLIVNSKRDEIFSIDFVVPTINELKKHAKEVKFFISDSSKHNIRWYPILKDTIKNFIHAHKRNPFPDRIFYATEKPDTFCRKYWVKIDRIGKTEGGKIEDSNQITINDESVQLFPRRRLFGQIEVQKIENKVFVKTQNVKKYTLLISPDVFDLDKPIEVYTNGNLSFNGKISKSLKTLLNYYIEDNDRTMLFSSELSITVGKTFKQ